MKRGEIWWAQVDEPCPVVYLSALAADMVRAILIVAPAQRKIDWLLEIDVGALEGLFARACYSSRSSSGRLHSMQLARDAVSRRSPQSGGNPVIREASQMG